VYSIRIAPDVAPIGATLIKDGKDSSAFVSMTGTFLDLNVTTHTGITMIAAAKMKASTPPNTRRRRPLPSEAVLQTALK